MKDAQTTVIEIFQHLISSHPELQPAFEQLIFSQKNVNFHDIEFLLTINAHLLQSSKSQLRQDLFVLSVLNYKRNGFFVEFGATNGVDLSNTYLLEKEYGWKGILAEPARCWHSALKQNRSCDIETQCVWKDTGSLLAFNEVKSAELSTIHDYSSGDMHIDARKDGMIYDVRTISLIDLLQKYNAPSVIDYLSIDTEGSEFEILSNFDFSKFSFKVITCEHNYTPMRDRIRNLLSQNGYIRLCENLSKFDDWYIKSAII